MNEFWIIAGLMSVIALAFIAWPVWRSYDNDGQWPIAGLVAAALFVPSAVYLYRDVTTWSGAAISAPSVNSDQIDMVNQLAAKMQENPDDVEGWLLLGRSYLALEQFMEARGAFLQAWQRTPNPDNSLKLGLGMAMIHSDRAALNGDGGALIEEVLRSDPNSEQALFYGGMGAYERGEFALARDRWSALLAMNPPDAVARVIQQQVSMATAQLGPESAGQVAQPGTSAQPGATAQPSAAIDGPAIPLRIALGDAYSAADFGPQARVFIFARAQAGGPPLAVIPATVADLPAELTLSNANVMIQGNSLSNFNEIRIVARVSRSGTPTEQSGDVFAETLYNIADGGPVELVMNQVVP